MKTYQFSCPFHQLLCQQLPVCSFTNNNERLTASHDAAITDNCSAPDRALKIPQGHQVSKHDFICEFCIEPLGRDTPCNGCGALCQLDQLWPMRRLNRAKTTDEVKRLGHA